MSDIGSQIAAALREHLGDRSVVVIVVGADSQPPSDAPLNPGDIARRLSVSPATVISWIRTGQLKAANIAKGKRPRFVVQPTDLEAFLKMRQPEPPAPTRRAKPRTKSKRF